MVCIQISVFQKEEFISCQRMYWKSFLTIWYDVNIYWAKNFTLYAKEVYL